MSNNPFMYQMGLKLGAEALMDTARAFGLGERTGLPIPDDPGLVPTSDYMIRNYKRDSCPETPPTFPSARERCWSRLSRWRT